MFRPCNITHPTVIFARATLHLLSKVVVRAVRQGTVISTDPLIHVCL